MYEKKYIFRFRNDKKLPPIFQVHFKVERAFSFNVICNGAFFLLKPTYQLLEKSNSCQEFMCLGH